MKHNRRRSTHASRTFPSVLDRIPVDGAGIDCGAAEHSVSVPPDRDPTPLQSLRTVTADLHRPADGLVACHIISVAMDATGVYWFPVYDILEARGLDVLRVNARHVTHVPGRKSAVEDCEGLRELHSVGLLRGSVRPAGPIRALRALVRHRDVLVQPAGTSVQRMQQALVEMNRRLPRVVSDSVGKTGLTILRALVAGERDRHVLAPHRDPHCKATPDEIAAAVTGPYRSDHLFVLQQNLELFDRCQTQLLACDGALDAELQRLTAAVVPPTPPRPRPRITRRRGNDPHVDLRPVLHHLTGVDLTQIDGLAPYSALKMIVEISTDLRRWPPEHHFTAWLTRAPQNRISGGRRLSSTTHPSANRAAGVLRIAAMSLVRGARPLSGPSPDAGRSGSPSPKPSPPPPASSPSSSTAH